MLDVLFYALGLLLLAVIVFAMSLIPARYHQTQRGRLVIRLGYIAFGCLLVAIAARL